MLQFVNLEKAMNMKGRLQRMQLRMCDEATGEIGHTRVVQLIVVQGWPCGQCAR